MGFLSSLLFPSSKKNTSSLDDTNHIASLGKRSRAASASTVSHVAELLELGDELRGLALAARDAVEAVVGALAPRLRHDARLLEQVRPTPRPHERRPEKGPQDHKSESTLRREKKGKEVKIKFSLKNGHMEKTRGKK